MVTLVVLVGAAAAFAVPAVSAAPSARPSSCASPTSSGGDWPSGRHDLASSGRQDAEHVLGAEAAKHLAPAWAFDVDPQNGTPDYPNRVDVASLQSTPIVAGGCVFVATKQGDIEALNADNGALAWKKHVDVSPGAGTGGTFVGAPTYHNGRLFVLVNELDTPHAIAVNASTGHTIWTSPAFVPPTDYRQGYYTEASAVVTGRLLIAGFSPQEGDDRGHGGFSLIDITSGHVVRTVYTIPREDWAGGCPDTSPEASADQAVFPATPFKPDSSCAGGGIWTTPAVDPSTGYAYMGTGNPYNKKGTGHARTNAILKVDVKPGRATFGQVVASYAGNIDQGPAVAGEAAFGASRPACYVVTDPSGVADSVLPPAPPPWNTLQQFNDSPTCGQIDLDFGGPNLVDTPDGLMVGDLQKSGVYHLVDTATMGRRHATQTTLSAGCLLCNGSTPAFDPMSGHVIAAVSQSTIAFDPRAGTPAWTTPRTDTFFHYEPVSIADGVAYILCGDGTLMALDETSGVPLSTRNVDSDTGGKNDAFVGTASSGVAIARHTVYVAAGHHLVAYRPS